MTSRYRLIEGKFVKKVIEMASSYGQSITLIHLTWRASLSRTHSSKKQSFLKIGFTFWERNSLKANYTFLCLILLQKITKSNRLILKPSISLSIPRSIKVLILGILNFWRKKMIYWFVLLLNLLKKIRQNTSLPSTPCSTTKLSC